MNVRNFKHIKVLSLYSKSFNNGIKIIVKNVVAPWYSYILWNIDLKIYRRQSHSFISLILYYTMIVIGRFEIDM